MKGSGCIGKKGSLLITFDVFKFPFIASTNLSVSSLLITFDVFKF